MAAVGKWKIIAWKGGYPVWCELHYEDREIARLHHKDLHDLEYAVKRTILEARDILPNNYKHEMD
jgi:hypothetical protein